MADAEHRAEQPTGLSVQQLDLLPMACFGLSADGRVTFWNRAAHQQFGIPEDVALGRPAAEIITVPADRRSLADALDALRAGAGVQMRTLRADAPGGRTLRAEWSLLASHTPDGSLSGVTAVCQGVTFAPSTSTAEPGDYPSLLDALPDSLYLCRRDGLILEFRPAPRPTRRPLPPDGYVGKFVAEIVDPDLAETIMRTLAQVADTGVPHTHKYPILTPSGPSFREARFVRHGFDTVLALVRDVDDRVRTEVEQERLVQSLDTERRQLDAVLRQFPAMICITDAHGLVQRVNDRFLEMLGVTEEQVIGRAQGTLPFTIVDETGRPLETPEAPSVRALAGERVSTEVGVRRPTGLLWFQVLASPIRNERGEVDGAILTMRDLTAERAAADALRQSEATNRALLEAIPDSMYRIRHDGTVLLWRPARGMTALPDLPPDLTGLTLDDILPPAVARERHAIIKDVLTTGRAHSHAYSRNVGDGDTHREVRIVKFDSESVLCLVRNIDAQVMAERERERLLATVEAERRRLNAVFRQAPNGLLVYDADGKIVQINDALAAIVGRPKSEIIGLTAVEAGFSYHDESGRQLDPHELPSSRALRGESVNCVVYGGAPRRPVWLHVSAAPIRDEQGAIVGAIAASRNITAERVAAEALKASEERNRALLDAIPDTIYVGGRDGVITDYKAPGDGRTLPVGRVVGRNARELLPQEVVDPLMQVVNRALDTGEIQSVDYLMPTDAGFAYREARIVPYGAERVLALVRDVDAQRRAEQERERLHQKIDSQRRRLDVILRQLPNTLMVLDREGRIEEVNDGFMARVGLPKERVIGQTSLSIGADYRHPDGRLLAHDEWPSVRALAGEEFAGELRRTGPDGTVRWLQAFAAPIRDERGAVTGAIISTRDISAERAAMAALQQSEARMRALLDAIPDSLYVTSRDGVLVDYKPPRDGRPMFQQPQVGRKLIETWPGPLGELLQNTTVAALDRGELTLVEYVVPTQTGTAFREARVVPNGPDHVLALVRDIDARKRAEQALHALNQELEQRVEARTAELEAANHELAAFSYSVSHDLKAPLRGIDGYSRLLWEDYQDRLDDDGRLLLQNVRQGAAQMYQLIDDLLAYSRLERRAIEHVQIELSPIVDGLIAERADEIEASSVHLTVNIPDITVRADRDGLAQAVRNLLENALRFTGGADTPVIAISATVDERCCILSVRDNGIGFDMAYHDRIFEIFQRLHRAEEYPGTGIGLALVRKAMQRMGGQVWAESSPGAGATFYLELPR